MTTPHIEVRKTSDTTSMGGLPAPAGSCAVSDTRLAIRGMVTILPLS